MRLSSVNWLNVIITSVEIPKHEQVGGEGGGRGKKGAQPPSVS